MARLALSAIVGFLLMAIGFIGSIGASLCDTGDCPSATTGTIYEAVFMGGGAAFVLSAGALAFLGQRRRRR